MSKVYHPIRVIDVPASEPHPVNTQYRVSWGNEYWGDGHPRYVYKIQMVYEGSVAGRKSPSYPEDSDDLENVLKAMQEIRNGGGTPARGVISAVGPERGMPMEQAHHILDASKG